MSAGTTRLIYSQTNRLTEKHINRQTSFKLIDKQINSETYKDKNSKQTNQ